MHVYIDDEGTINIFTADRGMVQAMSRGTPAEGEKLLVFNTTAVSAADAQVLKRGLTAIFEHEGDLEFSVAPGPTAEDPFQVLVVERKASF